MNSMSSSCEDHQQHLKEAGGPPQSQSQDLREQGHQNNKEVEWKPICNLHAHLPFSLELYSRFFLKKCYFVTQTVVLPKPEQTVLLSQTVKLSVVLKAN